jgi:hypothetical protein
MLEKIPKNLNSNCIPETMLLSNETIEKDNLPQAFANHFQYKIKTIIRDVKLDT